MITLRSASLLATLLVTGSAGAQKKNVLFIAVDDRKPCIGAHGLWNKHSN